MTEFEQEFDRLVQKYTELLTGNDTPDVVKKVKIYALYSYIYKTMPALAKHWLSDNPDAKKNVKDIFEEIQTLNQQLKQNNNAES